MKTKTHTGSRLAAGLSVLTVALLLATASPARAQQPFPEKGASWWDRLEVQLVQQLEAPDQHVREQTLQNITFFATHYGERADFTEAVPALLDLYESDAPDAQRMLALVALHAIGDVDAMQRLSRRVRPEESERVRRATLLALADYATAYESAERAAVAREVMPLARKYLR